MPDQTRLTVIACAAGAAVMLGGAFASKPLYDTFCRVTGFGGETRRAEAEPTQVLDRTMKVRFDANVARGVPIEFTPLQRPQTVQLGESTFARYRVTNQSNQPIRVIASYNVTPHKAGPYFAKLECFCFQDLTLDAKESVELPVVYFVDPRIAEEEGYEDVRTITLSYTFFESSEGVPDLASVSSDDGGPAS